MTPRTSRAQAISNPPSERGHMGTLLPADPFTNSNGRPVAVCCCATGKRLRARIDGGHNPPGAHLRRHWPDKPTSPNPKGDGRWAPEVQPHARLADVEYGSACDQRRAARRFPSASTAAEPVASPRARGNNPLLPAMPKTPTTARRGWSPRPMSSPGSRPVTPGMIYPLTSHNRQRESSAEYIYDTLYCARGQAENLIKLHKDPTLAQ